MTERLNAFSLTDEYSKLVTAKMDALAWPMAMRLIDLPEDTPRPRNWRKILNEMFPDECDCDGEAGT